jgi:hypothetical protein
MRQKSSWGKADSALVRLCHIGLGEEVTVKLISRRVHEPDHLIDINDER